MTDQSDPTPYELEQPISKPALPGEVIVRPSSHDAIESLAADLLIHAHNCVRAFGDFHLCLSGHPAIEPVLLRLLTDPAYRELPWRRTHLWCFAEHRDTTDGAEYDLIRETITIHADLPAEQAHPIDPSKSDAASRYEGLLRETIAWREKGHDRPDFVLLAPGSVPSPWGAGSDADGLVRDFGSVVACTPRLINASRFVAVYAAGERSRDALRSIEGGEHPLGALAPVGGTLRWYLDEAACGPEDTA